MIKKSIKTIAMVGIISICIVGNSLAATTYTTREKINSTGNIIYNDTSSGNKVFFDSSDLTTLADKIDDNNAVADTKIETVQNNLNESLKQVQTTLEETKKSVADGKSLIASAVTKKGVSTASDATFKVMSDNIISMALQQYNSGYGNGYVDGQLSKNTSGKVTYVRHYHAGSSSTGGGCYTIPNYHRHVEGTCYYKCGSHTKNMLKELYSVHRSGKGDLGTWRCNTCGYITTDNYGGGNWAAIHMDSGDLGYDLSQVIYRCGKTTDTIYTYSPSCGYSDGQILSATITY